MLKQIILITDGNSNTGVCPEDAAAEAFRRGVVVNVIGIVDAHESGMRGEREIERIAQAGGGLHRIVAPSLLARTMRTMTQMTIAGTIRQVVNSEIRAVLGDEAASITALAPEKRAEIVRAVDEWTETSPLRVALVIDASASMKHKFDTVREAAVDFMLSLRARQGRSELAVLHFPGNGSNEVELDAPWTSELAKVENILYKLNVKGTTPTGPALLAALRLFETDAEEEETQDRDPAWDHEAV